MGTLKAAPRATARRSFGVTLLIVGCWVAALAFYASVLPWRFGVWADTEPMVVALHAAALLCAAGLATCASVRPLPVARAFSHPAVLAAMFVALWSVVASVFTNLPVLSLLGAPQLGEGGLFFFDAAAFLAAGMLLRRLPRARRLLVWPGTIVCVATPLLVAIIERRDAATPWWLFKFDDYLAWYAVAGTVLVLALSSLRFWRRLALAAFVAVPGLAVSGNLTAIAAVAGIAFPFAAAAYLWSRHRGDVVHLPRYATMIAVPLLAAAGIAAVWIVGEAGWVASLTSRLYMYRSLLAAFAEHPAIFFVGQGWGQINTAVLLHLADSGATIWDGSWDLSTRDIPHSHNFAIEAFAGAGMPALFGVLALLAAIPASAGRHRLPVAAFATVAVAGLGAMWFQLPATSGLVMVALGAAAGGPGRTRSRVRWHPRLIVSVLVFIACAQAAALAWLVDYGVAVRRAIAADFGDSAGTACGAFPDDAIRGDVGLAQQFGEVFSALFADQTAGATGLDDRWAGLVRLHCVVARRAAIGYAPRLMLADLLFRSQIAIVPALQSETHRFAAALAGWEDELVRFVAIAPGRSDIAAPYLSWRLSRNEPAIVVAFARRLLLRNPDDPIGHWFLGAGLAASGSDVVAADSQQILAHLRRALVLGLERRIKVDPALIRFLDNAQADDSGQGRT